MAFKLPFDTDFLFREIVNNSETTFQIFEQTSTDTIQILSYNRSLDTFTTNTYNLTSSEVVGLFFILFDYALSYDYKIGSRSQLNKSLQNIFSDDNCFFDYSINGIRQTHNVSITDNVIVSDITTYSTIQRFINYNLYEKPLDNSNLFQALNAVFQTTPPTLPSSDIYDLVNAFEKYNANFFRARDFNEFNALSASSSSSVDLSTINTQLTNIANNLKTTVHDDGSGQDIEVSVTEIIKDKEDTVNVLNQIQEVETKNKELVPFLNNDEWSF